MLGVVLGVTYGAAVVFGLPRGHPAIARATPLRVALASAAGDTTILWPGGTLTDTLTLTNRGRHAITYTVRESATGDPGLEAAVVVVVKTGVRDCASDGFDDSGTTIAQGTMAGFSPGAASTSPRPHRLAAGHSTALCIKRAFPDPAANGLEGRSAMDAPTIDITDANDPGRGHDTGPRSA